MKLNHGSFLIHNFPNLHWIFPGCWGTHTMLLENTPNSYTKTEPTLDGSHSREELGLWIPRQVLLSTHCCRNFHDMAAIDVKPNIENKPLMGRGGMNRGGPGGRGGGGRGRGGQGERGGRGGKTKSSLVLKEIE